MDNCGSNAVWNDLYIEFDLSKDSASELVCMSVYDENSVSNTLIGEVKFSIVEAVVKVGTHVQFTLNLPVNKKGISMGRLVVQAMVEVCDEKESELADTWDGYFHISKIIANNLKNTELLKGHQDPFVKISVGKIFADKTCVNDSAGMNTHWDYLDFKFNLTAAVLKREKICIQVFDSNFIKDSLIGCGETTMSKAGLFLGKTVELVVNLIDAQNKPSGKVVLFVTAKNKEIVLIPPSAEDSLPESFVEGLQTLLFYLFV